MASMQRSQCLYAILQCLFLILLLCKHGTFADNKNYNMSTLCDRRKLPTYKTINGAVLTAEVEANFECVVTFLPETILHKFMLRFEKLLLGCNEHLYIFDGAHAFGSYKADLSCHHNVFDVGTIFMKSSFATLKYVTGEYALSARGFELIITAFKDKSVECGDFLCLNDLCIAKDLTCDSVDHCGDYSDETIHAFCVDDTPETKEDISGTKANNSATKEDCSGTQDDISRTYILGMTVFEFAVFVTLLFACSIIIAGIGIWLCWRARQ